jgi:hypothetical protein
MTGDYEGCDDCAQWYREFKGELLKLCIKHEGARAFQFDRYIVGFNISQKINSVKKRAGHCVALKLWVVV